MGLSGPKKRTKISNDPNNLAWANSTSTFGHKILTSKGWKPGEYLGAKDAAHADHYTAANASSIRVVLREDNLGLGAKIGRGNAETFGLSMLSGLLGRLNGKSDTELQAQQSARRDVELRTYQANKYGTMNFVYGGLLIGDKIEEQELKQALAKAILETETQTVKGDSRKRKDREELVEGEDTASKKKPRKAKKLAIEEQGAQSIHDGGEAEKGISGKPGKEKKRKEVSSKAKRSKHSDDTSMDDEAVDDRTKARKPKKDGKIEKPVGSDGEKARAKEGKRARKEEHRKRKEERRRKKAEKKAAKAEPQEQSSASSSEDESAAAPTPEVKVVPASINRHAVRHRYIQQKRMASMDPQALKEIFMLQVAS